MICVYKKANAHVGEIKHEQKGRRKSQYKQMVKDRTQVVDASYENRYEVNCFHSSISVMGFVLGCA